MDTHQALDTADSLIHGELISEEQLRDFARWVVCEHAHRVAAEQELRDLATSLQAEADHEFENRQHVDSEQTVGMRGAW